MNSLEARWSPWTKQPSMCFILYSGKLSSENLSQSSKFMDIRKSFLHEICGCGIFGSTSELSAKVLNCMYITVRVVWNANDDFYLQGRTRATRWMFQSLVNPAGFGGGWWQRKSWELQRWTDRSCSWSNGKVRVWSRTERDGYWHFWECIMRNQ